MQNPPADELKLRNTYVVGFKGFKQGTTAAHALRTFRPYNGKTCYFHNNIAYIAFTDENSMNKVCQTTILDQGYRLTGKIRTLSKFIQSPDLSTYPQQPPNARRRHKYTPHSKNRFRRQYKYYNNDNTYNTLQQINHYGNT